MFWFSDMIVEYELLLQLRINMLNAHKNCLLPNSSLFPVAEVLPAERTSSTGRDRRGENLLVATAPPSPANALAGEGGAVATRRFSPRRSRPVEEVLSAGRTSATGNKELFGNKQFL